MSGSSARFRNWRQQAIAAPITETATTNGVDFGGGAMAAVYPETIGYLSSTEPPTPAPAGDHRLRLRQLLQVMPIPTIRPETPHSRRQAHTPGSCRHPITLHSRQVPSRNRTIASGCFRTTTGPPLSSAGLRFGRSREGLGGSGNNMGTGCPSGRLNRRTCQGTRLAA
jgi:hypothetical protein